MRSETIFVPMIPPSLNKIHAGMHWTKRKRYVDAMHKATQEAAGDMPPFDKPVEIKAHARLGKGQRAYDLSNYAFAIKLAEDALVQAGILAGDESDKVVRMVIERPVVDRKQVGGMFLTITEVGS